MQYNITITNDSTPQAKSLLMLLQTFAVDYDFLQIEKENKQNLSKELKEELDFRYEHFLNHAEDYNDWDIIKHKYVKE